MTRRLRVVFMGSPEFAVPSLVAVHAQHQIVAVVTQPDRPSGRGRVLTACAVKNKALALSLPIMQPEKLRDPPVLAALSELAADIFVVVAYGQILSPKVLAIPPLGCINVHGSLLPKYRGAAPIQWAVLNDEKTTGVTIMQMDPGVDTGPILAQQVVGILADDTSETMYSKLAAVGATLLTTTLPQWAAHAITPQPQNDAAASLAPMLKKEDGKVDFSQSASRVSAWIRGMDPWPGAYCTLNGDVLRVYGPVVEPHRSGQAGEILSCDDRGLLVACRTGAVWIRELQRAGKRRMSAQNFTAGKPLPPGTRFS